MDYKLMMLMITMIIVSLVFPAISVATLENLICTNYDPKATMAQVDNNDNLNGLCGETEQPELCLDFLGNKPDTDLVFPIKSDVTKVRRFLTEAKVSFDACPQNYNDMLKSLGDVIASCDICIQQNRKCPPGEGAKMTTALNSVLTNIQTCKIATDTKDLSVSITKILDVAKRIK